MEQIVTVILAIISAVATGGWFVNAKLKKSNEKVDLTDKIFANVSEPPKEYPSRRIIPIPVP